MEYTIHSPYLIIHLIPDESVITSLISLIKKEHIQSAVVLSGIGQLKHITLGYFKERDDYHPTQFINPHELLSLSGTIIQQANEVIAHLHAIIGDEEKKTYGGHLIDATVEITNEIILCDLGIQLKRKKSERTGLMELCIS